MLSPGAEPRQALRYQPHVGDERVIVLESRMDLAMSSNGHLVFGQKDETTGRISLRVDAINGDRITLALTVIEMKAPSFDPTDFTKPTSLAGKRGTVTMTDRGKIVDVNLPFLETNETARDALQISDYLVLLPEEPVGLGARWRVHTLTQRNGIGLIAIDTHDLVELAPTTARTRSTLEQDSWPQVVRALAQDPVTVFEVTKLVSTGSGETQLSFGHAMPLVGATAFEFTADMSIRRPEQIQAITMTMKANIRATTEDHGGRPR